MSDDLALLEDWVAGLLHDVAPAGRRKLAKAVATTLRRSQQQRIAAQLDPDGAPYAARKSSKDLRGKQGRIKQTAMFAKLRTARWLKARATPSAASVEFVGHAASIAAVHQYGEVDQVSPGGPRVRYAQRQLLGFNGTDRAMIRDTLIDHLAR